MFEVYTIGGGEYIVNVFNAVAAWTGGGGYKSMIQAALVMAFAMSLMILSFNSDWRAWMRWFIQSTLMYMCLMVPRADVLVVDSINPGLGPNTVANVPLGLAAVAGFTSQVGNYLVTGAETVFAMPDDVNYSRNGMIYGSRLMEATQGLSISDPYFASSVDEYYRMCTFYDLQLGLKSWSDIAEADDLWAAVAPRSGGGQARSMKLTVADGAGGSTSSIVTCQQGYDALTAMWDGRVDGQMQRISRRFYPGMTSTLAKAKLYSDMPAVYNYLLGVSKDASQLMRQTLAINAMQQAITTQVGSVGSGTDVYAQTRAQIQTRKTYEAVSHNAMEWVPILNIVLTVVFYALFPIIFPLFLVPTTGPATLKSYILGFFYLAAWGPIYVILNMIVTYREHATLLGSEKLTLITFNDIQSVNSNTAVLAGYLIASIPFIAAGMAKGAMALSGHATSFLAPSQNAAEEAGREAATGNISLGNTTLDTMSFNNRQAGQWNDRGTFQTGAGGIIEGNPDGSMTGYHPGGTVVDQSGGMSKLSMGAQLSQNLESSFTTQAAQLHSVAQQQSNAATQSFTAANTAATEFRNMTSSASGVESAFGAEDGKTITLGNQQIQSAGEAIHAKFGVDRDLALNMAQEKFLTGQLTMGGNISGKVGAGSDRAGASAGLTAGGDGAIGRRATSGESQRDSASQSLANAKDYLDGVSRSQNWASTSGAYHRIAETSRDERVASLARSMTASYTQAQGLTRESRVSEETAQRFEEAASLRRSEGLSTSENLNQPFVNYVLDQQRQATSATGGQLVPQTWNPTRGVAVTPQERAEQAMWMERFTKSETDRIREGVADDLVDPAPANLVVPRMTTPGTVQAQANTWRAQVGSHAPGHAAEVGSGAAEAKFREREGIVGASDGAVGAELGARHGRLERPASHIRNRADDTFKTVKGDREDEYGILPSWMTR